jgi:N-methylhydantoinase A
VNRIGVDLGGTFTDLVTFDALTGDIRVLKVSSTPEDPGQAVLKGITATSDSAELAAARLFIHSCTVGLNALLQRRGATVGLLTTKGFRDVFELRRGDRDAMYDLLWAAQPPLVPRELRVEVRERILADGSVYDPLDADGVRTALARFNDAGVDSIAVMFMNSYVNGAHEKRAQLLLREGGFRGDIALSHQLSGQLGEYERTSTAVVEAFIRPIMRGYLGALREGLSDRGFRGDCVATTSGGGALLFEEAQERSFQTIMSGPAAGVIAAAKLAQQMGTGVAVSADVGGTSFDTCLITQGSPRLRHEAQVGGIPIQTPWIDVRSIGAGGGSIAYVDAGGLLRVGPESAGAQPGPACYGRGGRSPTVTDAAVLLGLLAEGSLSDGLRLDADQALEVVEPLAHELGMDAESTAVGILRIACASMAESMREVTLDEGLDPREATLILFGGAGPMLSTILARELDTERVLVPEHAGNFSAAGLLVQDLEQAETRTVMRQLSDEELTELSPVLTELFATLDKRMSTGMVDSSLRHEVELHMRYRGQDYSIPVLVPLADLTISARAEELRALFEAEYTRVYGHTMPEPVEVVMVRAILRRAFPPLPDVPATAVAAATPEATPVTRAYSFEKGTWLDFRLLQRDRLPPGRDLAGPALIKEPTSITYLDEGYTARTGPAGSLIIRPEEV